MKKGVKKLRLSTETVRILGLHQMEKVVGYSFVSECDTCDLPGNVCQNNESTHPYSCLTNCW